MNTILVILAIATVLAIAIVILQKTGKIKDEDGDVEDVLKNTADQLGDVVDAMGGSKRKGRKSSKPTKSSLRGLKKEELLKLAKKDFKVELDSNLTKTNLVNKVYELYHKK